MPKANGFHGVAEEHALQLTRSIPFIPDQPLQPLESGLLGVGIHERVNARHPSRTIGI